MFFRNLFGLFVIMLFLALVVGVLLMPRRGYQTPVDVREVEVEDVHKVETPFVGRMILPEASDIEVLDNSAGRDMEQMARFLQGRAAGLHWLANEHFKKAWRHYRKRTTVPDIHARLILSVDSMGVFQVDSIMSDTDDMDLAAHLQDHIKKYWRYRRSTSGKTDFIVPFIWTSKY